MITLEQLRELLKREPTELDLIRANCDKALTLGHYSCGICTVTKLPRYACSLGHSHPEKIGSEQHL